MYIQCLNIAKMIPRRLLLTTLHSSCQPRETVVTLDIPLGAMQVLVLGYFEDDVLTYEDSFYQMIQYNDLVQRGEQKRGQMSSGSTITCDRGSMCRVLPILTRALLLPLGIEDGGIEEIILSVK